MHPTHSMHPMSTIKMWAIAAVLLCATTAAQAHSHMDDTNNVPQFVAQNGSMLILLPANSTVSVQWMDEHGEPQGSPVALATVTDLHNLRSELMASINANTAAIQQSITSDQSTMTVLLSDKASNNDLLNAEQELYAYATNYTNTQAR